MPETIPPASTPPSIDAPGTAIAPAEPRLVLTHGGLAESDPWAALPARAVEAAEVRVWPFGLAGLAETLEVIALALVMFMAVRFVSQNFIVDGASMEPNFSQGDLLIVNRLAYRSFDISWLPWSDNDAWRPFGDPTPGDVVVFSFSKDPERDFIKRVIAVPGQTVEVRDGVVYVNGVTVVEPYIAIPPRYKLAPDLVPEGKLFVLGDNRNNSYDSHSWGMLDRTAMIGRADLRYWPPGRTTLVSHHRQQRGEGGAPAAAELSAAPQSP